MSARVTALYVADYIFDTEALEQFLIDNLCYVVTQHNIHIIFYNEIIL